MVSAIGLELIFVAFCVNRLANFHWRGVVCCTLEYAYFSPGISPIHINGLVLVGLL